MLNRLRCIPRECDLFLGGRYIIDKDQGDLTNPKLFIQNRLRQSGNKKRGIRILGKQLCIEETQIPIVRCCPQARAGCKDTKNTSDSKQGSHCWTQDYWKAKNFYQNLLHRSIGSKVFQFLKKTLCTSQNFNLSDWIHWICLATWHPHHVKVAPLQAALFCSKSTDLPGPWLASTCRAKCKSSIHYSFILILPYYDYDISHANKNTTLHHPESDSPRIEAVRCVHPQPNWQWEQLGSWACATV